MALHRMGRQKGKFPRAGTWVSYSSRQYKSEGHTGMLGMDTILTIHFTDMETRAVKPLVHTNSEQKSGDFVHGSPRNGFLPSVPVWTFLGQDWTLASLYSTVKSHAQMSAWVEKASGWRGCYPHPTHKTSLSMKETSLIFLCSNTQLSGNASGERDLETVRYPLGSACALLATT